MQMTPTNKVKQTLKYRVLKFIWVKSRRISIWAGKHMIKMLVKIDGRDVI